MKLNEATLQQNLASTPTSSTWLLANAGSGKTRVLTDRVARLLLRGADPQSILCLTFTKAAAGEMQNRLFQRLGAWSMLGDSELRAELEHLSEAGPVDFEFARTLFARAIETPGGLKIQTIHAFCASLLRKFPVEAGVTPGFSEIDEARRSELFLDVLDEVAEAEPAVFGGVADHLTGDDAGLIQKLGDIASKCDAYRGLETDAAALEASGISADTTPLTTAFDGSEADLMREVIPVLAACDGAKKTIDAMLATLRQVTWADPTIADLESLFALFLYKGSKDNGPDEPKLPSIPPKSARDAMGHLLEPFQAFMQRVGAAKSVELSRKHALRTAALHRFAAVFLGMYEARKAQHGWLDFDDLIRRAEVLLSDQSVAAWVLYRLDGGLDHVLIDEAQDTSPAQWSLIRHLTEEIAAGEGARSDRERSFFVVGDKKQSIYSFQGADAEGFDRVRDEFRARLVGTTGLQTLSLEYSFRSSPAVLEFVDQAFDAEAEQDRSFHNAFFPELPGRVDIWPLVPKPDADPNQDWHVPLDRTAPQHEAKTLARMIASEIKRHLEARAMIPTTDGERPLSPGDFMILVQRRGPVFRSLIQELKAADLPVAGADRLRLGEEIAVQDILSLLKFLALPEDDLSLAEALRSPLFGWSEDELFRLAAGRGDRYLWAALREDLASHEHTHDVLSDLRSQADYLRPFELIERVLVRHNGRQRLMARLGPEIQDGLDELLTQALLYEAEGVPNLSGFVALMDSQDIEIKRQMEVEATTIRVMTVHGAKGLEAPVVILPDTVSTGRSRARSVLPDEGGRMMVVPPAGERPAFFRGLAERAADEDRAERDRLLYVAMTRAQNWLIVCGAGQPIGKDATWHDQMSEAAEACGAAPLITPAGAGLRIERRSWPAEHADAAPGLAGQDDLPKWTAHPPPAAKGPPATLSPSDLGGAKALSGEPMSDDPLRYGRQLHLLLEHLPEQRQENWPDIARRLLTLEGEGESDLSDLLDDARKVLLDPGLAPVFGADGLSEVPITATLDALGGQRILGVIDRLVIDADRIWAIDFKSNTIVPDSVGAVPDGLLRQMGAYAAALAQVYPGRRIDTSILWTQAPVLMDIPHEIVMGALQRPATS